MPNKIYEIYADGKNVGITIALNATLALQAAYRATTRRTVSKMDVACDFEAIVVCRAEETIRPIGSKLAELMPGSLLFTSAGEYLPLITMGQSASGSILACRSLGRNAAGPRSRTASAMR